MIYKKGFIHLLYSSNMYRLYSFNCATRTQSQSRAPLTPCWLSEPTTLRRVSRWRRRSFITMVTGRRRRTSSSITCWSRAWRKPSTCAAKPHPRVGSETRANRNKHLITMLLISYPLLVQQQRQPSVLIRLVHVIQLTNQQFLWNIFVRNTTKKSVFLAWTSLHTVCAHCS